MTGQLQINSIHGKGGNFSGLWQKSQGDKAVIFSFFTRLDEKSGILAACLVRNHWIPDNCAPINADFIRIHI